MIADISRFPVPIVPGRSYKRKDSSYKRFHMNTKAVVCSIGYSDPPKGSSSIVTLRRQYGIFFREKGLNPPKGSFYCDIVEKERDAAIADLSQSPKGSSLVMTANQLS